LPYFRDKGTFNLLLHPQTGNLLFSLQDKEPLFFFPRQGTFLFFILLLQMRPLPYFSDEEPLTFSP
jgi:hypothetical protein